jgi:hypothetical protein
MSIRIVGNEYSDMATELRDERGGHNLHDVHIIGITATGLAKKCWFIPGDLVFIEASCLIDFD